MHLLQKPDDAAPPGILNMREGELKVPDGLAGSDEDELESSSSHKSRPSSLQKKSSKRKHAKKPSSPDIRPSPTGKPKLATSKKSSKAAKRTSTESVGEYFPSFYNLNLLRKLKLFTA